jgi:hypothetical protein
VGTTIDKKQRKWTPGLVAGVLSCAFFSNALAQDGKVSAAELISDSQGIGQSSEFLPLPLLRNHTAGLAFDIAGSDQRKLSLQISEPISLDLASSAHWLNLGGGSVMAGGSLEWAIGENLGLDASVLQSRSQVDFQALGSIHCENGILAADSYRASDCYFVNNQNSLDIGLVSVGASYQAGDNAVAAINLFRQEATADTGSAGPFASTTLASPLLDPGPLAPFPANFLQPMFSAGQGLGYLDTEVSGIDLEFKLGVSTDHAGDMQLGLQFTHVLDGDYRGLYPAASGYSNWSLAAPFDSARLSFDWQKNSFSGGVQGYYREPVQFLDRSDLDAMTTFDVYFTWRAPWNASLSVGASNVLNSGADDAGANENKITDPFESVYGRIPYVRYQQDL